MNHEIMMYGLAQKEQLGFDVRILPLLKAPLLYLSLTLGSPTLVREQKAVEECKYRESRLPEGNDERRFLRRS